MGILTLKKRDEKVHVKWVTCSAGPRPVRYADLGGIETVLADIRELVERPLRHPEV